MSLTTLKMTVEVGSTTRVRATDINDPDLTTIDASCHSCSHELFIVLDHENTKFKCADCDYPLN